MAFSTIDWIIVAAYFLFSAGIGFLFTKRGGESLQEYFISGRNVPWWLAGISMVATTFAADTPLAVTGLVASNGVAGNWVWWNMVMSGMLTVFFFARLWRRAGVMTDVELAEVRYGGRPAAILRGFRAVYLGIPINLVIMGWVTSAMVKILSLSLGIPPMAAVAICFFITVAYVVAAGMWAVLWTDAFQFVLMMTAVIVLAYFAVDAVGGMAALKAKVAVRYGSETAALSVLPLKATANGLEAYAWMPLLTILTFVAVQWWAAWYPGAEPGGGGYVAQRIFSAKTERDGVLATLFFQVAHYALRPWPWIVTGLATTVLYPNGIMYQGKPDNEGTYVQLFLDYLPSPWRGIMLAGFAAAYMSTMATQLNWGASYLVNDVYKRFMRRDATERHYVNVSRVTTVALFLAALVVMQFFDSIKQAWNFLLAFGAGTGLVLILRWYWWRINAWSEISAMCASFVVSVAAMFIVPRYLPADDVRTTSVVLLVTVAATSVVWIATTFLTAPESDDVLDKFYQRVRPGGPGWAAVSTRLGYGREPIPGGALTWTNWIAGVIAVYASLFGIGRLVFGDVGVGLGMLVVAALAFAWIARSFRSEPPVRTPATGGRPAPAVGAD